MAETRKYDPAAGNAIAQALKAAMGEPVRPNLPGARPAGTAKEPAEGRTSWVTVQLNTPAETDEPDQD